MVAALFSMKLTSLLDKKDTVAYQCAKEVGST